MFDLLKTLGEKKPLSSEQMNSFIQGVASGKINLAQQAAVISALNVKGITAKELAALVRTISSRAQKMFSYPDALALSGTVSVATCTSALGIPVVRCGDKVDQLDFEKRKKVLEHTGLCFLEMEKSFPDFQYFSRVRKALGMETIFDVAELLLNPVGAKTQLIVLRSRDKMKLLIEAAKLLKLKRTKVIFGDDEAMHCAHALKLYRKNSNLKKTYQEVKKYLLDGNANHHFSLYKKTTNTPIILLDIVAHKKYEIEKRKKKIPLKKFLKKVAPSDRDFKDALKRKGVSLIAEILRASPFEGKIVRGPFSVERIAKQYEASGARAISVLTDTQFFQGSLHHLQKVREATKDIPLLCRDYVLDEYQIYEARFFGADAILLKALILTKEHMKRFLDIAKSLKMQVVFEVHSPEELKLAIEVRAEIILVNSRITMKGISKSTTNLLKNIPADTILVCENGMTRKAQLKKLPKRTEALLTGSSFLKRGDISKNIEHLIGKPKPFLKLNGIQSLEQALYCSKLEVDMIGLDFTPKSLQRISYQLADRIIRKLHELRSPTKVVGIFENQDLAEVNTAAEKLDLDFIQLSGDEQITYIKKCRRPVIKEVPLLRKGSLNKAAKYSPSIKYLLLHLALAGSRKMIDQKMLMKFPHPYFISGNMPFEDFRAAVKPLSPTGIDMGSGFDTPVEKNFRRLGLLVKKLAA